MARGVAVDDWPTLGATIGYPVPLTTSVYGRGIHEGRAVLGEALATCALCLVALNAVSSEKSVARSSARICSVVKWSSACASKTVLSMSMNSIQL